MRPSGRSEAVGQVTRRSFLGLLGTGAAAAAAAGGLTGGSEARASGSPPPTAWRHSTARDRRFDAARLAFGRGFPAEHPDNGDERLYPNRIGNYSKVLPHDALGEVSLAAYDALLAAVSSGDPADFERIPLGGSVKLRNPQAGLTFELEGPDTHDLLMVPPPAFASAEIAGEVVELYWMALARDINFADYLTDPLIAEAGDDLSALREFRGPKHTGRVTPGVIFRGNTPGDLAGPFVSQFLLRDYGFGTLLVPQRMRTVVPNRDYLTDFGAWLSIQNGNPAPTGPAFDGTRRYIRNLRDLAEWVRIDVLFQSGFQACLILLGMGVPFKPGNPYVGSRTQVGLGSFGAPHVQSLVGEIAVRALRAVWYHKWFVHRRLRPEEFAGRVHVHLNNQAAYPIHPDILNSVALSRIQSRSGSALLPQAFPDGCPTHTSYGGGHATVAGATITLLKAWFDENFVIPNPVVPNADGTALVPYAGPDRDQLTVGNELNKLASNIGIARDGAGIHYRSDYFQSILLGEQVAIAILEEQKIGFNEPHSFTFTRFDGTAITI